MRYSILWVSLLILLNQQFSYSYLVNYFIPNQGQIINDEGSQEEEILYYSHNSDVSCFIKKDELSIVLSQKNEILLSSMISEPQEYSTFRYDIKFLNINLKTHLIPTGESDVYCSFYINDIVAEKLKTYRKLNFIDYYENINLIYYYKSGNLKYDFVLRPGADVGNIEFKLVGVNSYWISEIGDLIIETPMGNFIKPKPIVYQYDHVGKISYVDTEYQIIEGIISFIVLDEYDISKDLIIDPELGMVSYCGGSSDDALFALKQDTDGNYYMAGETSSINFPVTPGAFQQTKSSGIDCTVLKFNSGMKAVWITFIGGNATERFLDLNIDMNNIWLVGETTSSNFPLRGNSFQKQYGGGSADIIIARISNDGLLNYSTYFGSGSYDSSPQSCVDNLGNLWLTGRTNSGSLHFTSDAEQTKKGSEYASFILKFSQAGNLLYSSFYSSDANVYGEGIACDEYNNIYITGYSDSKKLPNSNIGYMQFNQGNYDAFVAKFNNNGKNIWSAFYGGSANDYCSNITIDEFGDIYIFGHTNSANFPIIGNAIQKNILGSFDTFIVKMNSESDIIWSTYFGGNGFDGFNNDIYYQLAGLDVRNGVLAVAAMTTSSNLKVTPDAYQSKYSGGSDSFVALFDTKFGTLNYCSYFGGSSSERPYDIIINKTNSIVNVGRTLSKDINTSKNAFQKQSGGQLDGYIFTPTLDFCQTAINYPTFHNVNKIFLNGNAMYIDDYIRLTNSVTNQSSSMWYIDKIRVDKGFETTFSFSITDGKDPLNYKDKPFPGADGIAFLIQNHSILTKGSVGGSIGYQGIPNSLAIEYDMFYNTEKYINDPDGNHLAVFSKGKQANVADHESDALLGQIENVLPFRTDGSVIFSKIIYDGNSNKLSIFLAENPLKLNDPILEINDINLNTLLETDGDGRVWVGFTSATGRSFQKHNLLSWELCSYDDVLLSVDEFGFKNNNMNWNLYPNPVMDYLNLVYDLNDDILIEIEVVDILGRSQITRELNRCENYDVISINVSQLLPGIYFCKISGIEQTFVIPFAKQ
jgi:hypothetical protein